MTSRPLSPPTVPLHRLEQMQAAHPAEGIDREEDGVGVGEMNVDVDCCCC